MFSTASEKGCCDKMSELAEVKEGTDNVSAEAPCADAQGKPSAKRKSVPKVSGLYSKINALRSDILLQDWSDDKMFNSGNTAYEYLSADKVKRTLAPLFSKFGLEVEIEFTDLEFREPVGKMTQHWTIKLIATIIDIDTGESTTSKVYGEAGDTGDKGINKAQTCAIKQWVFAKFLIADGIDPDADVSGDETRGSFSRNNDAVKSTVLSKTVKPATLAPAPMPTAAPKPKVAKTPAPAPAVKVEEPAEKVEKTVAPEPDPENKYTPSGPQANAIKHIQEVYANKLKAGEITGEVYNKMLFASTTLTCQADVMAFIKQYRTL